MRDSYNMHTSNQRTYRRLNLNPNDEIYERLKKDSLTLFSYDGKLFGYFNGEERRTLRIKHGLKDNDGIRPLTSAEWREYMPKLRKDTILLQL